MLPCRRPSQAAERGDSVKELKKELKLVLAENRRLAQENEKSNLLLQLVEANKRNEEESEQYKEVIAELEEELEALQAKYKRKKRKYRERSRTATQEAPVPVPAPAVAGTSKSMTTSISIVPPAVVEQNGTFVLKKKLRFSSPLVSVPPPDEDSLSSLEGSLPDNPQPDDESEPEAAPSPPLTRRRRSILAGTVTDEGSAQLTTTATTSGVVSPPGGNPDAQQNDGGGGSSPTSSSSSSSVADVTPPPVHGINPDHPKRCLCMALFPLKKGLQRHLDYHAGLYRKTCGVCGKQYQSGGGLGYHMRKVHGQRTTGKRRGFGTAGSSRPSSTPAPGEQANDEDDGLDEEMPAWRKELRRSIAIRHQGRDSSESDDDDEADVASGQIQA